MQSILANIYDLGVDIKQLNVVQINAVKVRLHCIAVLSHIAIASIIFIIL